MHLKIYDDHQGLSDTAANEIVALIRNKPGAVLCLASGETPRLTCQLLVQKVKNEKIDISLSSTNRNRRDRPKHCKRRSG